MQEIPILFIKDDDQLIEMYREYFQKKGYKSILIRNGKNGLEQAMSEGSSLITLRASSISQSEQPQMPIILVTDNGKRSKYRIKPVLKTKETFSQIKLAID